MFDHGPRSVSAPLSTPVAIQNALMCAMSQSGDLRVTPSRSPGVSITACPGTSSPSSPRRPRDRCGSSTAWRINGECVTVSSRGGSEVHGQLHGAVRNPPLSRCNRGVGVRSGSFGGLGSQEEWVGRRRGAGNRARGSGSRATHLPPDHGSANSSLVRWDCDQPRRDAQEAQTEAAIGLTTTYYRSGRREA